jgi:hypothetical protein
MVVASTHQEFHISCAQCSHLLAVENNCAFRVGNRRLAFGELLRQRVEKAKFKLMAQISCPKILHGLLAAGTDIWLAELSRIVLGRDYVSTVVRFF